MLTYEISLLWKNGDDVPAMLLTMLLNQEKAVALLQG